MQTLYIITGPAGVGKSTISKKIAEHKNRSVLIEGDEIYHQIIGGYVEAWKSNNHLKTFWKICINMIKISRDITRKFNMLLLISTNWYHVCIV